ncbi:MAG: hypothetical protein M1834_000167 [Cirrosporium novae-zelandiae]|nr:MAG: hypothetical protein M1834_000167 [Cirrosporium novae-zelandiae]
MSSSQVKRPFQPRITSFFDRTDEINAPTTSTSIWTQSSAPSVPRPVQTSLLNVGMRIRKSVPSGYKTKSCSSPQQNPAQFPPVTPTLRPRGLSLSKPNNLMPWCGIIKDDGMSTEPTPSINDVPALAFDDSPPPSQGSQFPNEAPSSTPSPLGLAPPPPPLSLSSSSPQRPRNLNTLKRSFQDFNELADPTKTLGESGIHDREFYPIYRRMEPRSPSRQRSNAFSTADGVGLGLYMNSDDEFKEADFLTEDFYGNHRYSDSNDDEMETD